MKTSCFLAPIHPAKYNHGQNFVKSYNKHFDDGHLYLVFSNKEDELSFKALDESMIFRSIIYDGPVYNNQIVTQKKWYGLNYIFHNTDFDKVAVVDVDCLIIDNKDYDTLFDNYIKKQAIFATQDDKFSSGCANGSAEWYMDNLRNCFSSIDDEKLKDMTGGTNFWFNELPIYYKSHFLEFLEYIQYTITDNRFNHFDYISYAYYLLLKEYCKLIKLPWTSNGEGFLECQSKIDADMFSSIFHSYNPMWIRHPIENMKNVFLVLHVDR